MDAAGSRRAVVFGASEGGAVAIQLCCDHPQRVAGLCLFAALPKGTASATFNAALQPRQYDLWMERLVAEWGTSRSVAAFAPSHATDPTLKDWWARLLRLSSSPGTIAAILQQLRDVDVTALLPRIGCPTILLHRRGDRAVRIEASRFMARLIAGATLVELEGEDHWWWLDDVDVLVGRLVALRGDDEGRAVAAVDLSGGDAQAEKARRPIQGLRQQQGARASRGCVISDEHTSGRQDAQKS